MYARAGRRDPFTAGEAAAELDVHRNIARSRLDRLVEAGFLAVALERRGRRRGPGAAPPAKVYCVAPELEGVEFPGRRLAEPITLLDRKVQRGSGRKPFASPARNSAASSPMPPAWSRREASRLG